MTEESFFPFRISSTSSGNSYSPLLGVFIDEFKRNRSSVTDRWYCYDIIVTSKTSITFEVFDILDSITGGKGKSILLFDYSPSPPKMKPLLESRALELAKNKRFKEINSKENLMIMKYKQDFLKEIGLTEMADGRESKFWVAVSPDGDTKLDKMEDLNGASHHVFGNGSVVLGLGKRTKVDSEGNKQEYVALSFINVKPKGKNPGDSVLHEELEGRLPETYLLFTPDKVDVAVKIARLLTTDETFGEELLTETKEEKK